MSLTAAAAAIRSLPRAERYGRVAAVRGALIEVDGLETAPVGSRVEISCTETTIAGEIVGVDRHTAFCMPFREPRGVAVRGLVRLVGSNLVIWPCPGWLGRVVDGLGQPIDGKGPLARGATSRPLRASPPNATARARVGSRVVTGVNALDLFAPLARGQRMGLFAGSGVGKSVLLSMLARWTQADVAVIGLVGERGREVQEFIEDDLGPEGLARSVIVVATSDEPALMRRQAAFTTLAVAEYFRDQGLDVLCMMDSVTRFAMAQREIGLSAGEPATTRGYTPSVFAELPRLLERAGPGIQGQGSISALFSVLVDGDDHNEPVADAVRGILDGHIVMNRGIAERGRYPAIDVLKSVSRTLPQVLADHENDVRLRARRVLSTYTDMAEIIRLGAYKAGSNGEVDEAIRLTPQIEQLLSQTKNDLGAGAQAFEQLGAILEQPE